LSTKIDGVSPPFIPIGGLKGVSAPKPFVPLEGESDFQKILLEKIESEQKIKFSAHAKSRLQNRKIALNSENLTKLAAAMDRAEEKGARESLIVVDNTAFVVNVNKRTVITALDEGKLQDSVFTNIDSAVFVK